MSLSKIQRNSTNLLTSLCWLIQLQCIDIVWLQNTLLVHLKLKFFSLQISKEVLIFSDKTLKLHFKVWTSLKTCKNMWEAGNRAGNWFDSLWGSRKWCSIFLHILWQDRLDLSRRHPLGYGWSYASVPIGAENKK